MAKSGDEAQVEAGMEILRWQYDPGEWHRHVGQRIARLRHRGDVPALVAVLTGGAVSFMVLLIAAFSGASVPIALFAGVAAALVLYFVPRGYYGSKVADLDAQRYKVPRVLFTSTGIIFGNEAWLWRADHCRLVTVELRHGDPTCLHLEFTTAGLGNRPVNELVISIPSRLEKDVAELAELLQAKTPDAPDG